jgi:spore coat polysaccharide biosynthesis protein SpsF (cytidylyltransferase family)
VSCYDLPAGLFLSGLKVDGMKKLLELKASDNTEYWLYYYLKTDIFKVVPLSIDQSLKRDNYRVVLDYPEDFEMLEKLYQGLGKDAYSKSTRVLISYLDEHPELAKINIHCMEKGQERTDNDPHSKVKLK